MVEMNIDTSMIPPAPELSFPEEEGSFLRGAYEQARVILEYGSGGSTVLAASMPGKLVFSVESDRRWAQDLQFHLDAGGYPSPVVVHHADIGETGSWGRPLHPRQWTRFHHYPMDIWDKPWFRHPDLVLIDGRFRTACFAMTRLRIEKPVTVLFDDYAGRARSHMVEEFGGAPRMVGRMAVFELNADPLSPAQRTRLETMFFNATYVGDARYDKPQ